MVHFTPPTVLLPAPRRRTTRSRSRDPSPKASDEADKQTSKGYIVVHQYTPTTGFVGTPELLNVNLSYFDGFSQEVSLVELRLCAKGQYVPTSVQPGPNLSLDVKAVIPEKLLDMDMKPVQLSVHAYRGEEMVDFCDFGYLSVQPEGMFITNCRETLRYANIPEIIRQSDSFGRLPVRSSRKRARSDSGSESEYCEDSEDEYVAPIAPVKTRAPAWTAPTSPVRETKMKESLGLPTLVLHIDGYLDSLTKASEWYEPRPVLWTF